LNRYLLKNSSSIETEMRSLILPLECIPVVLVLIIYHYTLELTPLPLSANSGSLRQSLGLRRFRADRAKVLRIGRIDTSLSPRTVTSAILALTIEILFQK
jgi:hypothetical protein